VEVRGADDAWWDVVPGVTAARVEGDAVVLDLASSIDPQRLLDLARGAGDVVSFGAVRLTLAELFREVVS
jgi:ABC-2 type transport system ATP-binding protein